MRTLEHNSEPGNPIQVSIVARDRNDGHMLRRMLEQSREFATAGVFGSANEALEQVRRVHTQVLMMDIRLPERTAQRLCL